MPRTKTPGRNSLSFRDPTAESRFNEWIERDIHRGELLDLDWCEEEGFRTKELFRAVNLDLVINLRTPLRPYVVKLFYANLKKSGESIETYFGGRTVRISQRDINVALNTPLVGATFLPEQFEEHRLEYQQALLELDRGEHWNQVRKLTSGCLLAEARVVLFGVTHHIIPRQATNKTLTQEEEFILGSIMRGLKINFGCIVAHRMFTALQRTNMGLPYGHLICFLLEQKGFDLTEHEADSIDMDRPIGRSNLNKAGYRRSAYGGQIRWVRRRFRILPDGEQGARPILDITVDLRTHQRRRHPYKSLSVSIHLLYVSMERAQGLPWVILQILDSLSQILMLG